MLALFLPAPGVDRRGDPFTVAEGLAVQKDPFENLAGADWGYFLVGSVCPHFLQTRTLVVPSTL